MKTIGTRITWLVAVTFVLGLGIHAPARADEEPAAPTDPTRGHWDTYLDPVRDLEDKLTDQQKSLEDKTGVHVGVGITNLWLYSFNDPDSNLLTLHSLDPDHASPEFNFGQISASRANDGWIPGFGSKLAFGRAAKRFKADWDGDGALNRGDQFEKNSFEVQEAYLQWTVPEDHGPLTGLGLKAGKFVTLLGAEVIEPWANPNVTRSFLFGYSIPFTHTGFLLSYPFTDKLNATAGMVVGWDNVADNNQGKSAMGNLTYTLSDQITLSSNVIWGPEQTDNNSRKRGVISNVATIKANDRLTFLLNYDWGHEEKVLGNESALWEGFAAIATYNFTDRCSGSVRGEWFEDHNGARTGVRQTLWESTVTAKYQVTQHAYLRLEYRHDESSKGVFEAQGGKALAGQDIAGFEFTYLFN